MVVLIKELKSLQKSYALELKLGRPLNSKDPISLELVGKLCVNYASSSSLGHLRFLVFLLLGYAGFLRVDELHSLKVGGISLLMTIWQSPSGSEKNDQYREGHTVYIAMSGKVTCSVTTARRLLVDLTGSSSETPLIRNIVKSKKCFHPTKKISTTTNREEFNTHVLPFAVNIQQLYKHAQREIWCSMELRLLFITLCPD